jgi:hypothetical protein
MAEQSFLAKLGVRAGIVGSSAALAIAAPLANGNYDPSCHADSARIGWYFDRTLNSEMIAMYVGGQPAAQAYKFLDSPNWDVMWSFNSPSPTLTLGTGTGTSKPTVYISHVGTSGNSGFFKYRTNGVDRFAFIISSSVETGSNTGSAFDFVLHADDGTNLTVAPVLTRVATGAWSTGRAIVINGGTFTGSQSLLNASYTWNDAAVTFTGMFMGATNTASAAGSLICDFKVGGTTRWSLSINGPVVTRALDAGTAIQITLNRAFTLTVNVTDNAGNIQFSTNAAGAFTITRYNWFSLNTPTGTSTITDACVYRFNAAAGTHKAIDSGSTKVTPATVNAWEKYNINGTLYFCPCYTSKTA